MDMKMSVRIAGARMASSSELTPRSDRLRRCRMPGSAVVDLAGPLVDDALDDHADRERGRDQDGRDDGPLQSGGAKLGPALACPGSLSVRARHCVASHR